MRGISIVIDSDGCPLAATVRVPRGDPPYPAVLLTGPLSSVRDQAVARYAEPLTERGFLTVTVDHRNFGESGGHRRQHEDPEGKLADLRSAVTELRRREDVDPDRIALCGLSLGGGYALRAAATDPRVAAVVCVAGGFNSPAHTFRRLGPERYQAMLRELLDIERTPGGEPAYLPVVSEGNGPAMLAGEEHYDYYMTGGGRSQHWVNRITTASAYHLMTFDALSAAELIAPTPILLVHRRNDRYCSPQLAQMVYERAGGRKKLVWMDADRHVDLYDHPQLVARVVDEVADFLADR
jgi:fermentation-respiration switch protein FrsA (DUF1100 family)